MGKYREPPMTKHDLTLMTWLYGPRSPKVAHSETIAVEATQKKGARKPYGRKESKAFRDESKKNRRQSK